MMTSSVSLQILGPIMVAGLGLIPAIVAEEKGRSFAWWWLYGALFFPLAFPHAILAEDAPRFVPRHRVLPDAMPRSWKSYFGAESVIENPDPVSWDDLRMQQAGEYSGTSSRPASAAPKRTISDHDSLQRPTQSPLNESTRPAGWRLGNQNIRVRRDIDPIWPDRDYSGIRFPFISIVSVLALTMLVTAGAYEIAAGGWSAIAQQIATIGIEIEQSVLAKFGNAGSPSSIPDTSPAVKDAAAFPLSKPPSMASVAAIAPAAGFSPAGSPQLAAIPPQLPRNSEAMPPERAPLPEKYMQKTIRGDTAEPDARPPAKSQRLVVSRDVVRHVQKALRALGYAPGHIDGKIGAQTRDAIRLYQTHTGLIATGNIDRQLLQGLGVKTYASGD